MISKSQMLFQQTLFYFFFVLLVSSEDSRTSSRLSLDEIVKIPEAEDNVFMSAWKNRHGRRMCIYKEYNHPVAPLKDLPGYHLLIRMFREGKRNNPRSQRLLSHSHHLQNGNDLLIQTHPSPAFQESGGDMDAGNKALQDPSKYLCIYTTAYLSLEYIEPFVKDMIAVRSLTAQYGTIKDFTSAVDLNEHQKKVFRYYKSLLKLPAHGADFDSYIYAWITDKPCSDYGFGEPRYVFEPNQSRPVVSRTKEIFEARHGKNK